MEITPKVPTIILGYAGFNAELRLQHVLVNRTCREMTLAEKGLQYAEELFLKNLADIYKVMQWNDRHNIRFYRLSSDIAPHITNPTFLTETQKSDVTQLAYDLTKFTKQLQKIGRYIRENNIRLTFHPDLFAVLNSETDLIVLKTFRDLHFHATILDLMELDYNSVIVLHGGGVYGNKPAAMTRWIANFNRLPLYIKRRVVLENDETSYNIEDVLKMSSMVDPFPIDLSSLVPVPVVFDIFHYYCYNIMLAKSSLVTYTQPSVTDILPKVLKTWGTRHMKMHISEQDPNLSTGAHADFVNIIPDELFDFVKQTEKDLYLMIESKYKEESVLFLRKKYGDRVN